MSCVRQVHGSCLPETCAMLRTRQWLHRKNNDTILAVDQEQSAVELWS